MNRRLKITVLSGLILLTMGSVLFSSSMGFRLVYTLDALGYNGSRSGTNSLALPYVQHTSLSTASDLKDQINASAGSNILISLAKFMRNGDNLLPYSSTGTDFVLVPGEGYRVQVSQQVDLRIAGFHDPELVIHLETAGTNFSKSGTNDVAYPYHGVAETASDLKEEINAAAGSQTVLSIAKFVRATDTLLAYTGPATNFTLEKGTSYRIQVASDVDYRPAHY